MRKLLLSLTIIAGAVAVAPGAEAAPHAALPAPMVQPVPALDAPATVQTVQYYYRGGHRYYRGRPYYGRGRYYRYRRY